VAGDCRTLEVNEGKDKILAYRRQDKNECIWIAMNVSDSTLDGVISHNNKESRKYTLKNLRTGTETVVAGTNVELSFKPFEWYMFKIY
jgi:hypothetical protein